ncbi:MAG TPA: ABC transporter permease [Gemmatimonadales bacterium]|nr:ABC transporter permease [Gemmatimonadales bacterium]
MFETTLLFGFLAAGLRIATPLLFAATGELVAERGGVLNLGIEGAMLGGALAAALVGQWSGPLAGVVAAAMAGALSGAIVAVVAVWARADQVITGTAVTLGAVGLTGAVYRATLGSGQTHEALRTLERPELLTVLALIMVPAVWWMVYRTRWGLALRASGEDRHAAAANGVHVVRVQTTALLVAGAMAGLGGATLVLGQVGSFAEKMTSGRGFVAIAIVVLGRWHPFGVLGAALLFGMLQALQFLLQGMGLELPYQLFLVLPYALTLLALAGLVGRARAPAGLGR